MCFAVLGKDHSYMALHLSMSEKKKFLRIVYDPSLHYVIIKIVSNFFIKNKSQYLLYKENTVHLKAVTSLIFTMQYLVCKIEERELGKHVF